MGKPPKLNKPKGALRFKTCAPDAIESTIAELNAGPSTKPGCEWRHDRLTKRSQLFGEEGLALLYMVKKAEKKKTPDKKTPTKTTDKKTETQKAKP